MTGFIKISSSDIEKVFPEETRQYLVGNLKKPQKVQHIHNEDLEIGITSYSSYSTEPVHYHTQATEFQYMLSGWTQYMDIETGEIFEFKKGDFYCIKTNTTYAQKSKKGTSILFIKVPSINDKHVVETSQLIQEWYEKGLHTIRKDYFHTSDMPNSNSIHPAAAVAIVNSKRVLMLQRKDNGKWTLPGGTLEMNESLSSCAIREVEEETGLKVYLTDVIGTYTDPDIRIEYSDGEVRREFTIVYFGSVESEDVTIDDESKGYAWVDLDRITDYPMADSQLKRIKDLIRYLDTGKRSLG